MGKKQMREIVIGECLKGKNIASLRLENCVVIAIRRGDKLIAPNRVTIFEFGDLLTLLSEEDDIDASISKLS